MSLEIANRPRYPFENEVEEAIVNAEKRFAENWREGYSPALQLTYAYTCPSPERYHFQWFWDSCFHAIALSHLNPERAKKELFTLVSVQEKDGFLPHVIFWEGVDLRSAAWAAVQSRKIYPPTHTSLIQPPILAYATLRVYEKDKDPKFLGEMLPKLKKYYLWLLENRDPDGDGLISNISPYETGLDLSPVYAPPLGLKKTAASRLMAQAAFGVELRNRIAGYNLEKIFSQNYFNVEDVLVNTFLAQSLWALSQLCLEHEELEEGRKFEELAKKTEEAILTKCRGEDGCFYPLHTNRKGEEVKSEVLTFTSLFPLLLKSIDEEDVDNLISHLFNPNEFWTRYPVPSVAINDMAFRTGDGTMWGGSSWPPIIWALHQGLQMHDRNIEADALFARASYLGKTIHEYHNPFNGQGYGANNFTWAPALYCDMLKSVKNGNGKQVNSY